MTTPEPAHIHVLPRLGRGVCWADITAEIAEDEAKRVDIPNPWTPTDPKEAA
ncbi:DUF6222 family protein [Amycolatopsis sp. NPDC088138]|uniref:DUF6222 family protein n=1 Tax=Amycolatopsis sp. NPDC088138 TaxID=3363938 RepID=UPI003826861A